jgi:hypothetical protein
MKALSSLLLTGLAHGEDLKASPVFAKHAEHKKIVKRLIAAVFIAAAAFAAGQPLTLKSAWLDQSVSEHFSQKYGCPVRFKNVSLSPRSGIRFGSLAVRSKESRLLISATSGTVTLKRWSVRKDLLFEAEMHLENVAFEKEFYKNSPYFNKTFGHFMHKPLVVYDLTVNVLQDERFTRLQVTRCASKDVKVDGHLLLDKSRVVQDKLLVSFSPFMMVRAILPKDRADTHRWQ